MYNNTVEQAHEYKLIAVSAIDRFDESRQDGRGDPNVDPDMNGLIRDIKINGLLNPPTVELVPGTEELPEDEKRYRIIVGNRRFEAFKLTGADKIKCLVRPDMGERQKETAVFGENIHRRNYTPFEMAIVVQRMLDDWGGDRNALAKSLGFSNASQINEWLQPALLDTNARKAIEARKLGPALTAKRMAQIGRLPPDKQKEATDAIFEMAGADENRVRSYLAAIAKHPNEPARDVIKKLREQHDGISMVVSLDLNASKAFDNYREKRGSMAENKLATDMVVKGLIQLKFLSEDGMTVLPPQPSSQETSSTADASEPSA